MVVKWSIKTSENHRYRVNVATVAAEGYQNVRVTQVRLGV